MNLFDAPPLFGNSMPETEEMYLEKIRNNVPFDLEWLVDSGMIDGKVHYRAYASWKEDFKFVGETVEEAVFNLIQGLKDYARDTKP